jgi:outer membrane protein OmpA-like peptidoglycan-associated protein
MLRRAFLFAIFLTFPTLIGCGSSLSSAPVKTEAELGRVIVYRNGVAYFERTARVRDGELTLVVPGERVDDFLKSLTVEDARSGRTLPVSFPTVARHGDEVTMTIKLPHPAPSELKVTYVTESPAWKPSYRVVLSPSGTAKLEGWAVVDNVSGEDWKNVRIGVGSTSALSFRYDLHSVRLVERETLGGDPAVAAAPPTGGSPYQVASKEVQVVGNVQLDAVDAIGKQIEAAGFGPNDATTRVQTASSGRENRGKFDVKHKGVPKPEPAPPQLAGVAAQLRASGQRVRVEGYARPGEEDRAGRSLERANAVRDELVRNGVPASQVEAIGTGNVSTKDGARMLALVDDAKPTQSKTQASTPQSNDPIGSAYFVAPKPMTIEKDHSALVSILSTDARAEQVYYYDPISARGSKQFAFKAVRLENPSKYTLDSGPFTVYAEGQFLGEGLSEPIPPKSAAFIPFALDRKLIVEAAEDTREEIDALVTIERGIITTETKRIRRTKLSLHNQGETPARVFVRHLVPEGFKLHDAKAKFEKLRGAHLFPVAVTPKGATELVIEEAMPTTKTVDIRTEAGIKEIALFLSKSSRLDPELRKSLDTIVTLTRGMGDVTQRMETVRAQMHEYRVRIDEINVQLVSLRKVPHADKLSRHLAQKMEEISEKLQKATIQMADFESQLLTSRVLLQDRLADLTLEKKDPARAEVANRP